MFNEKYKTQTVNDLINANNSYKQAFRYALNQAERLYHARQQAVNILKMIDNYIVILANKPRDFEVDKLHQIRLSFQNFDYKVKEIQEQANWVKDGLTGNRKSPYGGLGLSAATAGASAAAPSVMLGIAMVFGTASTGTAISTLSGAAAVNAALAWLGGGTLAMGGLGVAGGAGLLATVGPVGLAISSATAMTTFIRAAIANYKIAKQAEESICVLKRETKRIQEISIKIDAMVKETSCTSRELSNKLCHLQIKQDYSKFTPSEKEDLIAFIDVAETLAYKIGETIQ